MKNLKLLVLLIVAAAALFALLGAGTASATVLCLEASCSTDLPAGTEITASLKSGTSALFEETSNGTVLITCSGTSGHGTTQNTGGSGAAVIVKDVTWTFKECTTEPKQIKEGEIEITNITGTHNGTVVARGYEITINIFGVSCAYGPGAGTDFGTLVGGTPAEISIRTVLPRTSGGFLCPSDGVWTAQYAITSPSSLFVGP